jgi:hypothetical protein
MAPGPTSPNEFPSMRSPRHIAFEGQARSMLRGNRAAAIGGDCAARAWLASSADMTSRVSARGPAFLLRITDAMSSSFMAAILDAGRRRDGRRCRQRCGVATSFFSMMAAGWNQSASSNSQCSRKARSPPTVDFPRAAGRRSFARRHQIAPDEAARSVNQWRRPTGLTSAAGVSHPGLGACDGFAFLLSSREKGDMGAAVQRRVGQGEGRRSCSHRLMCCNRYSARH